MIYFLYVLMGLAVGALGGFVNVLISNQGQFVHPYNVTDENDRKVTFWGSYTEIIAGAVAGPVTFLPILTSVEWWYVLYTSVLTGVGGSNILKSLSEKHAQHLRQVATTNLSNIVVTTSTQADQQTPPNNTFTP